MQDSFSVTELLSKATPGDQRSMAALLPLVYAELKLLAAKQLSKGPREGRTPTLQPTALVHEAFLKMVDHDKGWSGREHFMAVAATAMRQVLVDHARRRHALKRGGRLPGGSDALSIDDLPIDEAGRGVGEAQVMELDDLLTQLARESPRGARVAEMRLFGGMEQDQIARVLGVARMTVHRDWQIARAWLAAQLQGERHE